MLVVGPMYLAISTTASFSNHIIITDHWLWVMAFYALYLVVPLFERHFNLAWHGFTSESIYMRGTKSQSHGQCIYKTSHVFIRFSMSRGLKRLSSGFSPSVWLSWSRGSMWLSCRFPPSTSWKGDLLVIHIGIAVSHWIS